MFKKLELLISYLQTVNSSLVAQEAEQVIYQSGGLIPRILG